MNRKPRRRTAEAAKRSRSHAALSDELRREIDLALGFYRARRFSEAEVACRRVLAAQPTHPGTLNLLGTVLAAAGRLDEAIASQRKAIESKPDYAEAYSDLGKALCARGDLAAGIQSYQRVLQLNPEYAKAHHNLGLALQDQGKLRKAVESYKQALNIRPAYPVAENNLGVALQVQGLLGEATAAYRRAIVLDPDFAVAHSNLGDALWAQGELDEAVVACNRAIELDSAFALAHFNLGRALQAAGTLEAAAASYKQTTECDPGHLDAHFGLSAILNTTGRQAEARRTLEQGVRRQPIGIECTAKDEPHATILKLVGLQAAYLNIEEGYTKFCGVFLNTSFLIDSEKFTVHRYHILEDNLSNTAKADLPSHDIVLNGIVDPDVEPASLDIVEQLAARNDVPIVNDPYRIRNTTRDRICELLTGIDNLVAPRVVRERLPDRDPSHFMSIVDKHDLRFPLIVRPVVGHVGYGMARVDDIADFEKVMFLRSDLEFYLIELHEFQGDDGYYRNMRVFFIDGELYPVRLLISDQWNIHASARHEFMSNNAWTMDEEESFLEHPDAYLGQQNYSALEEINRRIGLDVFGVDYAMLPSGKLLLFEANAAMRVTMDAWHTDFPYAIRHTNKIKAAFGEMMLAKIGRS